MNIFIAADHRGLQLKNDLIPFLERKGLRVVDCGNSQYDAEDDYPDFAQCVARKMVMAHSTLTTPEESEANSMILGTNKDGSHNLDVEGAVSADMTHSPEVTDMGIVICGSGIGVSMATNRYKGIRCGLCINVEHVRHARENDHINVLALPSDMITEEEAQLMVNEFLNAAPIMKEKYIRRAKKLDSL